MPSDEARPNGKEAHPAPGFMHHPSTRRLPRRWSSLTSNVVPHMQSWSLSLALLFFSGPLIAAEEFVTSAFRVSVPAPWTLKRGGTPSALLEFARRPDCEMGGRLYETQHSVLAISWSANEGYDNESTNWGPNTPTAAYAAMVASWREQVQTREVLDAEIRELGRQPPIIKQMSVSGSSAANNRRIYQVAVLREEGFATLELIAGQEERGVSELILKLVDQMTAQHDGGELPSCRFRGTGGPRLWSTWPQAKR
jgi:hypothetical protein